MTTVKDDFNARVSGEVITTQNSIFTSVTDESYSPPAKYSQVGRSGSVGIEQKASDVDGSAGTTIMQTTFPGVDFLYSSCWVKILVDDGVTHDTDQYGFVIAAIAECGASVTMNRDKEIRIVLSTNVYVGDDDNPFTVGTYDDWIYLEAWYESGTYNAKATLNNGVVVGHVTRVAEIRSDSILYTNAMSGVYSRVDDLIYTDNPNDVPPYPFNQEPPKHKTIVWDKTEDRTYQTGVDKCVLYLPNGGAVPWNGITSVEINSGIGEPTGLYFDGVKYLDHQVFDDFSATLNAFTYPDEFDIFEGTRYVGNGVYVDGQRQEMFGLSYRTQSIDGHQIHLLYQMTAVPSDKTFGTQTEMVTPLTMSWSLSGTPIPVFGHRPTEHYIIETAELPEGMLGLIENILYGSSENSPMLPPIEHLVSMVDRWDPHIITPQASGIATLTPGVGDVTTAETSGFYVSTPMTRLVPGNTNGLYTLEETP